MERCLCADSGAVIVEGTEAVLEPRTNATWRTERSSSYAASTFRMMALLTSMLCASVSLRIQAVMNTASGSVPRSAVRSAGSSSRSVLIGSTPATAPPAAITVAACAGRTAHAT